jgi:hypothetical protein
MSDAPFCSWAVGSPTREKPADARNISVGDCAGGRSIAVRSRRLMPLTDDALILAEIRNYGSEGGGAR